MKLYIKSSADEHFPESNPRTPPEMLREFAKSTRLSDKRMVAYNPSTPSDVLTELIKTKDDITKSGVYHNPNTPEAVRKQLYEYFEQKGKPTMRAYHIQPTFASKSIRRTARIYPSSKR